MPFALVTIGLLMVVTGVKDTYAQFGATLKGDFTGPGNFTYWLAALGIVGALGYIKTFQPFTHAFLTLILVVMVLRQGTGLFDRVTEALTQGPVSPKAPDQSANASTGNQSNLVNSATKAQNDNSKRSADNAATLVKIGLAFA